VLCLVSAPQNAFPCSKFLDCKWAISVNQSTVFHRDQTYFIFNVFQQLLHLPSPATFCHISAWVHCSLLGCPSQIGKSKLCAQSCKLTSHLPPPAEQITVNYVIYRHLHCHLIIIPNPTSDNNETSDKSENGDILQTLLTQQLT